jgi:transmembrane sensor
MAKVVRFPDRTKTYEEAARWLARLDKGIPAEGQAELGRWLRADPVHREALIELAALWDEMDILGDLSALFPIDESLSKRRRARIRGKWVYAAAAVVCFAVVGWWTAGRIPMPWATDPPLAQTVADSLRTDVGAHATEWLPDGSVVSLNTDTEIDIRYSAEARELFLRRGEAHFSVVHDARRPFHVRAGRRVVQAIGTAFNVRLGPDEGIEVTVTQGQVKVMLAERASSDVAAALPAASDATDTTLVAGEVAILDMQSQRVNQLEQVDLDIKLAWRRGMLIFQGEPLDSVLTEVSRYTRSEFVVTDDALRGVRVGGYFRAGDIDGLLVALRDNFQIVSEVTPNGRIILSPAQARPAP